MLNRNAAETILNSLLEYSLQQYKQPNPDANIYFVWQNFFQALSDLQVNAIGLVVNSDTQAMLWLNEAGPEFQDLKNSGSITHIRKPKKETANTEKETDATVRFVHTLVTYLQSNPQLIPVFEDQT